MFKCFLLTDIVYFIIVINLMSVVCRCVCFSRLLILHAHLLAIKYALPCHATYRNYAKSTVGLHIKAKPTNKPQNPLKFVNFNTFKIFKHL